VTTRNGYPPTLAGCDVLPPMEAAEPVDTATGDKQPKGKPGHHKAGQRFAVLNSFVDATAADLTRCEILVWLVLYRDTRNSIAQTSQADIARRAGATDRAVRRAIKRLEGRGLLRLVHRGGLNRGVSKYRVFSTPHGP